MLSLSMRSALMTVLPWVRVTGLSAAHLFVVGPDGHLFGAQRGFGLAGVGGAAHQTCR
jgi:hypothetical protein